MIVSKSIETIAEFMPDDFDDLLEKSEYIDKNCIEFNSELIWFKNDLKLKFTLDI